MAVEMSYLEKVRRIRYHFPEWPTSGSVPLSLVAVIICVARGKMLSLDSRIQGTMVSVSLLASTITQFKNLLEVFALSER